MNRLKFILGSFTVLVLLVGVGIYAITKHDSTSSSNRDKYAKAYDAHSLGEPFNLLSKEFQNNAWNYLYMATVTPDVAYADVKTQLTGGGYQVVASHPDTATALYRDLITGDVSVKAVLSKTASGQTGVTVTVTGIGK